MTVKRDALELWGVMLLAVITCVLALLLIIGFLLLPVKTGFPPPARLQHPAALSMQLTDPGP